MTSQRKSLILPNSSVFFLITVLALLHAPTLAAPSPTAKNQKCEDVIKDSNLLLVELIGPITGDSKHYAQFMPNNEQVLTVKEIAHGAVVTEPVDCSVSSSDIPSRDSPICAQHSKMNVNPQRIPAVLMETSCTCSSPNHNLYPFLTTHIRCVPLEYIVKVYIFDEKCENRQIKFEKIPMGCKAVFQNTITTSGGISESEDDSVQVPT